MNTKVLFTLLLALGGCSSKTEVLETYGSGANKLVIEHRDKNHYSKKAYYENGRLQEEKFFSYGLQDSFQYNYNDAGNKIGEMHFHNGDRNGVTHEFYSDGRIAFEGVCVNGRFEGLSTWYYHNGKIDNAGYRYRDKDTGRWNNYDSTGILKRASLRFATDSAIYYDGKGNIITHVQWEAIH